MNPVRNYKHIGRFETGSIINSNRIACGCAQKGASVFYF